MRYSDYMRAIVGARTSVINDAKVSHDAQRAAGEAYAAANGLSVVGYFEDLGVSASVTPFERADLGPWLSERKDEYDVIIWSKVDRAFRSSKDCADVAYWAEQNRKRLVFTDDGIVLDYREDPNSFGGMMAKFFLTIASLFGEMELRRFRSRASDSHRELKTRDRWASGVPPLGFQTVDHPSGKGKTLATDPEGKAILHDMANRLLAGESYTSIANHLNVTGARTNMSRASGREARWTVDNVIRALTTLRTQGIKMSGDQPVLDADGEYIRMAEPTFDDDMWTQIQSKAAERAVNGKRRAVSDNPILGVGFCECGASLTRKTRHVHTYYRCGRTPQACKGIGIKSDEAHGLLLSIMTKTFGDMRATRRVFVPGSDNSAELEQTNATIRRLRAESDAGLLTTPEDEADWLQRLKVQTEKRDKLTAEGNSPARWDIVQEVETYGEKYANANDIERRDILRNAGIRLTLHADSEPTLTLPPVLGDVLGADEVPVSRLTDEGYRRLVGNYVRAGLR